MKKLEIKKPKVLVVVAGGATALFFVILSAYKYFVRRRVGVLDGGAPIRRQLEAAGIDPDRYADYLVEQGRFARGWVWRTTASGERKLHPALDLMGDQGTTIYAVRSGIVEQSGQSGGYGDIILLRHADGSTSLYAHLNDRLVVRGDLVSGGEPIATMGRTSNPGNKPLNPLDRGRAGDPRCEQFPRMRVHLHWGIHGLGKSVDLSRDDSSRGPVPSRARARGSISTDVASRHGVDPVRYLESVGVRQFRTAYTGTALV